MCAIVIPRNVLNCAGKKTGGGIWCKANARENLGDIYWLWLDFIGI